MGFEKFLDTSFFDMWAVRKVGEKDFSKVLHFNTEQQADSVVKLLSFWSNTNREIISVDSEKDRVGSRDFPCIYRMPGYNDQFLMPSPCGVDLSMLTLSVEKLGKSDLSIIGCEEFLLDSKQVTGVVLGY